MYYYRKYMMSDLSLLNEITQSFIDPVTGETEFKYTQTVHIIGPLCEQWTEVTGSYVTNFTCSQWSTASAVDILWDQEPLLSFSSSEVWPEPSSELHTFGNAMDIYKRDYCERFTCPEPEPPTI
jgi:hypothetical protein